MFRSSVLGKSASLNIKVNGLAPGDDYFLIFINSTHGVLHATSPRFTILPASSSPNSSQPSPISGATTVTVSTGPDPTQPFATTFAAIGSGDLPRWGSASEAWGLGSVVVGCFVGAAWTLWWSLWTSLSCQDEMRICSSPFLLHDLEHSPDFFYSTDLTYNFSHCPAELTIWYSYMWCSHICMCYPLLVRGRMGSIGYDLIALQRLSYSFIRLFFEGLLGLII